MAVWTFFFFFASFWLPTLVFWLHNKKISLFYCWYFCLCSLLSLEWCRTSIVLCLRWAIKLHVVTKWKVKHHPIVRLKFFSFFMDFLSMFCPSCIYDLWSREHSMWIVFAKRKMMHKNQFPANKKNKLNGFEIPIQYFIFCTQSNAAYYELTYTKEWVAAEKKCINDSRSKWQNELRFDNQIT